MDTQWLLNTFAGTVASLLSILSAVLWNKIQALEEDLKRLPDIYARRDDMSDEFAKIIRMLERIEDRIGARNV